MNKTSAQPKPRTRRNARRLAATLLLLPGAAGWAGCGSPPSVVPVMRIVEQAILDEAGQIETFDADRDQRMIDSLRSRLREGYLADLRTTDTLDPAWVEDATEIYLTARETLVRQELDLAQQRRARQDNLRDAAHAQARAIAILQQQDRLLQQTVGLDFWRLQLQETNTPR